MPGNLTLLDKGELHNTTNGTQPEQKPVDLLMGEREYCIGPLGWRRARKWVDRFIELLQPYVSLVGEWKDLSGINIESDEGIAKVGELARLILSRCPNEVFELVSMHTALEKDLDYIMDNASTLQVAKAFAVMLRFEFPLEALRDIFGPLIPQTMKKRALASSVSIETIPSSNQQ
jgi:hypothetical protein